LPAWIKYLNGKIIEEIWFLNGELHCKGDLPSHINYLNGEIIEER